MKRISKSGRRVYVKVDALPKMRSRIGLVILSTSKGLMTDRHASKNKVGGEPLLMVW